MANESISGLARIPVERGCSACRETGYRGRIGNLELLVLDEAVRDAIRERRTSREIRRISRRTSGLVSLFENGLVKAARGHTRISELLGVLPRLDGVRPLPVLRRLVGE